MTSTDVTFDDIYKLGSTSVHIFEETLSLTDAKASSALVLCQSEMHRATLHRNTSMVDYTLSSLWITNHSEVSLDPNIEPCKSDMV
jgi:hypothetical protein